jgi:hypothetical protein
MNKFETNIREINIENTIDNLNFHKETCQSNISKNGLKRAVSRGMILKSEVEEFKAFEENQIKLFDFAIKGLEELAEYKKLEQQGLLIKLPCKIDSVVYAIKDGEIKVIRCDYTDGYGFVEVNGYTDDIDWELQIDFSDFGKTVFLSQEEAEKALEESKNNVGN